MLCYVSTSVNLKFLVKLGKTFTEAFALMKQVYGNECFSNAQVFESFKEQQEKNEDDPCPGQPSISSTLDENIEKIGTEL